MQRKGIVNNFKPSLSYGICFSRGQRPLPRHVQLQQFVNGKGVISFCDRNFQQINSAQMILPHDAAPSGMAAIKSEKVVQKIHSL